MFLAALTSHNKSLQPVMLATVSLNKDFSQSCGNDLPLIAIKNNVLFFFFGLLSILFLYFCCCWAYIVLVDLFY